MTLIKWYANKYWTWEREYYILMSTTFCFCLSVIFH